jgi:hypothetical protein
MSEQPTPVQSPPPTPRPAEPTEPDPRQVLHRLATELRRASNRKLLIEFLQLRRALRRG